MGLPALVREIQGCELCAEHLPLGPRPTLIANERARILVVGQAPGTRVHATGIPWNDPSGDRLRDWMRVTREEFYDPRLFAHVPMGFCYPGRGRGGDNPPRPECATTWHARVLEHMPELRLTVLLSQYSLKFYLGDRRKATLTETVRAWREYRPRFLPLPHPSPRNNIWLKRNDWFPGDVLPYLRRRVRRILREA